ncbi:alpha/beta hydrolase family protein [Niveispirillum fermenti]|uniref:alpha/beta hydrolase family protein n=1 Tax=Niveispirillum fermenti TaxID=1233113 RepID=UPI003A88BA5D
MMRGGWQVRWLAGAVAGLMLAGSAVAREMRPSDLPVEVFAHRPVMSNVSLSPDGSHVAYLTPIGGRQHLVVRPVPLRDDQSPSILAPNDAEITGIHWPSNERLLLEVLGTEKVRAAMVGTSRSLPLRFSRVISVSRDMKDMKVLLDRRPKGYSFYLSDTPILNFVDAEHVLMAYPADTGPWPGVVKVNIVTGRHSQVQWPLPNVVSYIPDPTGGIRVAATYDDRRLELRYLSRAPGGPFREMRMQKLLSDEDAFTVLGFGRSGKDLFVASRHEGDRLAVYTYDIDTDTIGGKIADDPRYDVGAAMVRGGAVTAVTWTDDLPQRRWLDPAVQKMQEALDKAVPDSREIIIDTAADGSLLLTASHSLAAPTTYRLFDRRTGEYSFFGDTYPGIPQNLVSARRPVSFKARDGLEIPGYLTLPVGMPERNLPLIVMPHGGPMARDDGGFDILSQFLASRGYAVLQPNFRGSTGYGAAFQQAGERQWGGLMQDDVTDAAQWAVAQGYADPARMCIVGWSYGGYAALMATIKTPALFKCAIATAPVTNLIRLYREVGASSARNLYRGIFFGDDPDELRPISPFHNVEKVGAPVLLIHGDLDIQATVDHSKEMARALSRAGKPVEYVEIAGMDHSPLLTDQMVTVLKEWERFLARHIGR